MLLVILVIDAPWRWPWTQRWGVVVCDRARRWGPWWRRWRRRRPGRAQRGWRQRVAAAAGGARRVRRRLGPGGAAVATSVEHADALAAVRRWLTWELRADLDGWCGAGDESGAEVGRKLDSGRACLLQLRERLSAGRQGLEGPRGTMVAGAVRLLQQVHWRRAMERPAGLRAGAQSAATNRRTRPSSPSTSTQMKPWRDVLCGHRAPSHVSGALARRRSHWCSRSTAVARVGSADGTGRGRVRPTLS